MANDNTERKPLSVSEAVNVAKTALESCTLTLVGEVSEVSSSRNYKAVYFTVKDENASLQALMWNNRYQSTGIELRVGMLVQITGRFTVYARTGKMNFDVFSLSLAGEGDLRARVAQLANKLKAEGLMEASRKRPLPAFPQTIGLVTSPRGAAVHDVLRTLRRRFPLAHVVFAGVIVEGSAAPGNLIAGIDAVCQAGAELILLVRGGGSFEDLMPFNDETLARTIAACPVPVVTGIGHEPDTSIADMVADLRASTPTAAAEAIAPDRGDLIASLSVLQNSMHKGFSGRLNQSKTALDNYASRPVLSDPMQLFAQEAQSLDHALDRLARALPAQFAFDSQRLQGIDSRMRLAGKGILRQARSDHQANAARFALIKDRLLADYKAQLSAVALRLDDLSPLSVLARGYALAKDAEGAIVKSVSTLNQGDGITLTVADGEVDCTVERTRYSDKELLSWKED